MKSTSNAQSCSKQGSHFVDIIQQHAANKSLPGFFAIESVHDMVHPKTLSYAQLDEQARKIAFYLHQQQLTQQPILLSLPNSLDFAVGFLGCLYAGVPVVINSLSINRKGTATEIAEIIEAAGVDVVLVPDDYDQGSTKDNCRFLKLSQLITESGAGNIYQTPVHDIALMYYSDCPQSGLTCSSLSYQALSDMVCQLLEPLPKHALQKGCCSFLSLSNNFGLLVGLLVPLYTGVKSWLIAPSIFDEAPLLWLHILSQEQLGFTTASTLAYEHCLAQITREHLTDFDLSSVEICLLGDEPLCYQLLHEFNHLFFAAGFNSNAHYPLYSTPFHPWPLTAKKLYTPNAKLHISKTALKQGKISLVAQHHPQEKIIVSLGVVLNDQIIIAKNDPSERIEPFMPGYIWVKQHDQWINSFDVGFMDNQGQLYRITCHDESKPALHDERLTSIKQPFFHNWLTDWITDHVVLSQTPINEHAHIAHYGIDSLATTDLSKAIEYTFGKPITPLEIWQHPSVAKLTNYVENRRD